MTQIRQAFEDWMVNVAKCVVGSTDPYPAGMERQYWECWQAAWNASQQAQGRTPIGWTSQWAIDRIQSKNRGGVCAKFGFEERISQKENDTQNVALYIDSPPEPMTP